MSEGLDTGTETPAVITQKEQKIPPRTGPLPTNDQIPEGSSPANNPESGHSSTTPDNPNKPVVEADQTTGAEAATEKAEMPELPPVSGERKMQEAEMIMHAEVGRKNKEGPQDKQNETPTDLAMEGLHFFLSHKLHPSQAFGTEPILVGKEHTLRVQAQSGRYVAKEKGGLVVSAIVSKEVRGDEVFFRCALGDSADLVDISVSELMRSQLMAEGDLIVESMGEGTKKRQLAEEYVAAQKAGRTESGKPIALESDNIESAGKEVAIPTSEAMRRLILAANEHENIDEETASRLLEKLDGTSLVDQHTAGEILATLDITGSQLSKMSSDIAAKTRRLEELKLGINAMEDGHTKQQAQAEYDSIVGEIAMQEARQAGLQKLKDALDELPGGAENAITNLLTPLYEGTMDPKQAQDFLSSLQNNDTEQLLRSLVGDLEKNDPENKYIEVAKNALKYGGLGTLAVFALMIMQAMQAK